jgi:hypothetical protein
MEGEIEGIEDSGFKPRVARVLSRGEADGGGIGRKGEDGRITRPSDPAMGGVGEGWKRRMGEERGSAVFIDVESGGGPVRAPCLI